MHPYPSYGEALTASLPVLALKGWKFMFSNCIVLMKII
jgi:hypothetical protein